MVFSTKNQWQLGANNQILKMFRRYLRIIAIRDKCHFFWWTKVYPVLALRQSYENCHITSHNCHRMSGKSLSTHNKFGLNNCYKCFVLWSWLKNIRCIHFRVIGNWNVFIEDYIALQTIKTSWMFEKVLCRKVVWAEFACKSEEYIHLSSIYLIFVYLSATIEVKVKHFSIGILLCSSGSIVKQGHWL